MKEDWIECTLGDVIDIISGKNQNQVIDEKGKYPIYGSGGKMGKANQYLCNEGTTIIGRKGTINSPIYVKEKFWNVDTAFGLSAFEILNNRMLYFFCVSFNFKALDKSTTIPSLAKRDLLQIPFILPPLPIQRTIVAKIEELFSSLDSGITDLKKAQEQLVIYRQAVLKKAFEGGFTKTKFKKESILKIGKILTGNTPSKKNKEYYNSNDKNFYKPSDLDFGINVFRSKDFLSKEGFEVSRQVPANSILVTCIGATIGKTGLIKEEGGFNQQINAIVPFEDFNAKYIYYQAIGIDFQTQVKTNSSSTTMPILNKSKFSNLLMNICSIPEQHQIVQEIESRLSVCDKVEESIKESLQKAEALRQSILKRAFEGKLLSEAEIAKCKADKDYEPASVLLQKIKAEKKKDKSTIAKYATVEI